MTEFLGGRSWVERRLCVPDRPTLSLTIFAFPTRSAPTDRPTDPLQPARAGGPPRGVPTDRPAMDPPQSRPADRSRTHTEHTYPLPLVSPEPRAAVPAFLFLLMLICLPSNLGGQQAMPCPHGRKRNQCKDCGGKGVCEHGRHAAQHLQGRGGKGVSANTGGGAPSARTAAARASASTGVSAPGARSAAAAAFASTSGGASDAE